jgi:hypothetical protein
MTQPELVQLVMDGFCRTLAHWGFWMGEVARLSGFRAAAEVEAGVGDLAWNIILKRLAQVFGVRIEDGVPRRLTVSAGRSCQNGCIHASGSGRPFNPSRDAIN